MPQLILAIHAGAHDASAVLFEDYDLRAAVSLERVTRRKGDGAAHPDMAIDEVLAIAGAARSDVDVVCYSRVLFPARYYRSLHGLRWLRQQFRSRVENKDRLYLEYELRRADTAQAEDVLDIAAFQRDGGFRADTQTYFYNHHEAHALPTLFYSPWDGALLATADGGGDNVAHSARHFANGRIEVLDGGEEMLLGPLPPLSLGQTYTAATRALGFRRNRHEGKVTGLAAMGKPLAAGEISAFFSVDGEGHINGTLRSPHRLELMMRRLARTLSREDLAASVQQVLEDTMLASLRRRLALTAARRLGLSGGVFANVKLNRLLAETLPVDEVFIFPAMGDDGIPVGGALSWLMQRDGLKRWLDQRRPLGPVYLGRNHDDRADRVIGGASGVRKVDGDPVANAAARLDAGQLGAIYVGRMEYGPRALGARTILANPARRETHDLLNERLSRSEFMPFAPVVTVERASDVFDITPVNARACRYMTIACDVRETWRARIPAVVHVDGSARPQVIAREDNPLYYDIIQSFERLSGLPVLVNTSFNVHEEPIVNRPEECLKALVDHRVDFVVTPQGLYEHQRLHERGG